MPIEKNRKRHSLKIPVPGQSDLAFYIWITDEISFVRQDGIHQEIRLSMRNNIGPTTRNVVVNDIDVSAVDPIRVEAINNASHKETQGIGQESRWSFLNNPPTHLKTHEVEIKAREEDGTEHPEYTLKLQKIDRFYVQETQGIGQEGYWALDHRDDEDTIDFANPDYVYDKDLGALRLDWFQNVVKRDIAKYMLVLYNISDIAVVEIKSGGTFSLKSKRTLEDSSWSPPSWWEDYNYPNPNGTTPFYLPTAQMKVSDNLHAMTCSIKVDDGVITLPSDTFEMRPMYNVADTLLKYAENTLSSEYSGQDFGLTRDPVINGQDDYVYNEYLDKFQVTETGLQRVEDGPAFPALDFSIQYFSPWLYPASPSALSVTGDRYSLLHFDFGYNGEIKINRYRALPFTQAQQDALASWVTAGLEDGLATTAARFGPGNSDLVTVGGNIPAGEYAGSHSGSLTTKVMIYGKDAVTKTDVFELSDITLSFDATWVYPPDDVVTVNYSDKTISLDSYAYPARESYGQYMDVFSFPYAHGTTVDKMFYITTEFGPTEVTAYYPYESWTTTDWHPGDKYGFYEFGWLQLSNGVHHIQGYFKNGQRRIYLDGEEKGAALATAIGCDLEDIVTMFLDVKKSDIDNLK